MIKNQKVPNKSVSDFDIRISDFVALMTWRDEGNKWRLKLRMGVLGWAIV
jgi:hypothetical protein